MLLLFSCSVVSESFWLHGLQHARFLCPSLPPWVCSNSCPLTWWCHPTILSSVTLFSCPQSFPASGSFLMIWLFTSGGQSIRASVSASVLPMSIQGWFSLGLTGLISLLSKGFSKVFSSTIVLKNQFFGAQPCLWCSSRICTWLLEKPYLWLYYYFLYCKKSWQGRYCSPISHTRKLRFREVEHCHLHRSLQWHHQD